MKLTEPGSFGNENVGFLALGEACTSIFCPRLLQAEKKVDSLSPVKNKGLHST